MPDIRKNLMSRTLLNKNGFKLIFESDKFTLSKGGMYLGKGYLSDHMFKLNVLAQMSKNNNNNINSSTYIVELRDV